MSVFIQKIFEEANLTVKAQNFLNSCNVQTPDELWNILNSFPSVCQNAGIDSRQLSFFAMKNISNSIKSAIQKGILSQASKLNVGYGAEPPKKSPFQKGYKVPAPPTTSSSSPKAKSKTGSNVLKNKIDVRIHPWPIKDQGKRGTCVAFAMAACREHLDFHSLQNNEKLSEQFLFWATKKHGGDPKPDDDGTQISYSKEAICNEGICRNNLWPYNPTPIVGNVTQEKKGGDPTSNAINDAKYWCCLINNFYEGPKNNNAELVYDCLERTKKPIAVSLPVFQDPIFSINNWTTPLGIKYGVVIDPPPMTVSNFGHAVCIVGFTPDTNEPAGGYFIIRNSWGQGWGNDLPDPNYHAFEKGYGQISATYINEYLLQMCYFDNP